MFFGFFSPKYSYICEVVLKPSEKMLARWRDESGHDVL